MLISDLITTLQREASETQDDDAYTALVLSWVQDAVNDIGEATDWKFFQATTPVNTIIGTHTYQLPASHKDIRFVEGGNGRRLEYFAPERLMDRAINLSLPGTPDAYFYANGQTDIASSAYDSVAFQVRLWPVPTAVETLTFYTQVSPRQLALTDMVPVTDDMITLVKHRVRYYILFDDKDYDGADRADKDYMRALDRKISKNAAQRDRYIRLAVTDVPSRQRRFARNDPNHFRN